MAEDDAWARLDLIGEYYDRAGLRIGSLEWSRLLSISDYRVLAQTVYRRRWLVSTVWVGMNHAHWPGGRHIFETMIFDDVGSRPTELYDRWGSEQDASRGHSAACRMMRSRFKGGWRRGGPQLMSLG